jgi:hypothetical protein
MLKPEAFVCQGHNSFRARFVSWECLDRPLAYRPFPTQIDAKFKP